MSETVASLLVGLMFGYRIGQIVQLRSLRKEGRLS